MIRINDCIDIEENTPEWFVILESIGKNAKDRWPLGLYTDLKHDELMVRIPRWWSF